MDPIETLTTEHRHIERVLAALEVYASFLRGGGETGRVDLARFVGFLREYADSLHHGKEEDLLFAAMVEAGFDRHHGPIGMMLLEHGHGRQLIGLMNQAANAAGAWTADERQHVADAATGYASLLRAHIAKEDRILYPMAEQHLGPEAFAYLATAFTGHAEAHAAAERRLVALADELEAAWVYGRRAAPASHDEAAAGACPCCVPATHA
ncbi:MAG TPA: hemerythrin domain-containing protein [Polyangia bacterium]